MGSWKAGAGPRMVGVLAGVLVCIDLVAAEPLGAIPWAGWSDYPQYGYPGAGYPTTRGGPALGWGGPRGVPGPQSYRYPGAWSGWPGGGATAPPWAYRGRPPPAAVADWTDLPPEPGAAEPWPLEPPAGRGDERLAPFAAPPWPAPGPFAGEPPAGGPRGEVSPPPRAYPPSAGVPPPPAGEPLPRPLAEGRDTPPGTAPVHPVPAAAAVPVAPAGVPVGGGTGVAAPASVVVPPVPAEGARAAPAPPGLAAEPTSGVPGGPAAGTQAPAVRDTGAATAAGSSDQPPPRGPGERPGLIERWMMPLRPLF
jgi:hypothetical protein